jgi:carboxypeptidase PM20D1
MKRVLGTLSLLLLALAAVLAFNTMRLSAPKPAPVRGFLPLDEAGAAQRLAGAIRIPTISYAERERADGGHLDDLHAYLQKTFPRVHAQLQREVVNQHSLLYTWLGSDPAAPPVLLLSHLDVVPIEPGTESRWLHAPFSGDIDGGFIWGRGTLDDKCGVIGLLEAAELMLGQGFHPRRTIYFAFGHDEEIGGLDGATRIAELLAARGVHAEFTLDEGGAITLGVVSGVAPPVSSIMAAEKGYASFRLVAHAAGGHSSLPPKQTAVGELARAVARVQDAPMPARLAAPVPEMLTRLIPQMPAWQRVVMANTWLFGPLVLRKFESSIVTNALVRTTTAPTMFHAGIKDNVLPSEAVAVVNFRLLPGDSIDDVAAHLREVIADDAITIELDNAFAHPATPVADTRSPAFAVLETTANEVFPETIVTTGLFIAAADNRHYARVRDNGYYFLPVTFRPEDIERVHGTNERIGVHDYARAVQYYARLMMNAAGG